MIKLVHVLSNFVLIYYSTSTVGWPRWYIYTVRENKDTLHEYYNDMFIWMHD
jgi:hypothetical protein